MNCLKNYGSRILPISLIVLTIFCGCQSSPPIKFKLKTPGIKSQLLQVDAISSYTLVFNPESYGTITVTFKPSTAVYEAENLNASQVSSLLILLNSKGLLFDSKQNEFRLDVKTL